MSTSNNIHSIIMLTWYLRWTHFPLSISYVWVNYVMCPSSAGSADHTSTLHRVFCMFCGIHSHIPGNAPGNAEECSWKHSQKCSTVYTQQKKRPLTKSFYSIPISISLKLNYLWNILGMSLGAFLGTQVYTPLNTQSITRLLAYFGVPYGSRHRYYTRNIPCIISIVKGQMNHKARLGHRYGHG